MQIGVLYTQRSYDLMCRQSLRDRLNEARASSKRGVKSLRVVPKVREPVIANRLLSEVEVSEAIHTNQPKYRAVDCFVPRNDGLPKDSVSLQRTIQ